MSCGAGAWAGRAAAGAVLALALGGAAMAQASPGVQPIKPCEPYPACLAGGGGGGGAPKTCAQVYSGESDPAYGLNMQSCCSSAANAGEQGCADFAVAGNTAACGGCAPPSEP